MDNVVVIQIRGEDLDSLIARSVEKAIKQTLFCTPTGPRSERRHMSPKEVEAEYGFKQKLLSYWRNEKMGPPYKPVGKRVFYERDELEKFLQETKIVPPRIPV